MTYLEKKLYYVNLINEELAKCFKPAGISFDGLLEAMDYSLMAGGKRIRPMLLLEVCEVCGGDPAEALPVACAVEMLHTYSLIHDDLPCMDNDELRRGRPTCHVAYGECAAVLAGDALQAEAFGKILRCGLPAEIRAACAEALADAAGVDGICGGQFLDMAGGDKKRTEEEIIDINSRKTGSLLIAACRMGAIAAGACGEKQELAVRYGAATGVAFQLRDDMLDVQGTDEELGKPVGSDRQEGKITYMDLYGEEKCLQMIEKLTEVAKSLANELGGGEFLGMLAEELAGRRK